MLLDPIDADLVRALLTEQFPSWAEEPVRAVVPGGWCHRTFRIGDERVARLPSAPLDRRSPSVAPR